jgi:hypothetical protein
MKKKKKLREKLEKLEVLVVKHHRLCFDIPHILSVVLRIFFNKTWDYVVIWIHVFNNTKKH